MNNERKLWQHAKDRFYTPQNNNIECTFTNNTMHTGSKNTSEQINQFFDTKIKQLVENIPQTNVDSLTLYKLAIKTPINRFTFIQININDIKNT